MISRNHTKLLTTLLMLIIAINLLGQSVPRETVVAEFTGGTITSGDVDDRIAQIPPMYQTKYKTEDGKKSLLDMMCTEEVFYKEAQNLGIETSDEYLRRIDMQVKTIYYRAFKADLLKENVIISDEEKREFFREHSEDLYAGRIYEEVAERVDHKMRPDREKAFLEDYTKKLYKEYNIKIDEEILGQVDLDLLYNNKNIEQNKIITSSTAAIEKDVLFLLNAYPEFPPQQKSALLVKDNLFKYINDIAQTEVFYHEALNNNYQENEEVIATVEQVKKNMMMKTVYNKLVINAIDLSDEALENYYEDHIDQFSEKASRKIQFFAFADQKTAKANRKQIKKLLKKNDIEAINNIAKDSSLYPKDNGKTPHIYQNGFIPGIGKDEIFSNKIWDISSGKADPSKLSDIFENSKGEFTFFRILEDNPQQSKPFVEVIEQIKSRINKEQSRAKFEAVTEELINKYNVVKYYDRLFVVLDAERYFELAEQAQKKRRFEDAIYYYEKIVKHHKNNVDDYKAAFMIAFIYSEELSNAAKAKELFNEFLDNYPEGELHDSARFMVEELNGEVDFESSFE